MVARWRHCVPCDVKWFGNPRCWVCEEQITPMEYGITTSGDSFRGGQDNDLERWISEGGNDDRSAV